MSKCLGITREGDACKGTPIDGSGYCYVHHPNHTEERRRNGSKGGKRGGRGRPVAEIADVKIRLSTLADDVLEGNVDKSVGGVVANILNVYLRAVESGMKAREQEELVQRLEELEEALENRQEHRRFGA